MLVCVYVCLQHPRMKGEKERERDTEEVTKFVGGRRRRDRDKEKERRASKSVGRLAGLDLHLHTKLHKLVTE